jgi:hypothetical protein
MLAPRGKAETVICPSAATGVAGALPFTNCAAFFPWLNLVLAARAERSVVEAVSVSCVTDAGVAEVDFTEVGLADAEVSASAADSLGLR